MTITAPVIDPVLQDGNAGSGVKSVNWPLTRSTTTTDFARLEAVDVAGQEAVRLVDAKVDADAPQVSVTGCPVAPIEQGALVGVSVSASDVGSGLVADPTGTYDLATGRGGHPRARVHRDRRRAARRRRPAARTRSLAPTPLYDFAGFFRPVSMTDVNALNAGRAVPIKFSLGGDQGMDVIEAGYPRSVQVPCDSLADAESVEPTSTPGASGLTYDAVSGQYQYVWKTDGTWAGQCRQFVLEARRRQHAPRVLPLPLIRSPRARSPHRRRGRRSLCGALVSGILRATPTPAWPPRKLPAAMIAAAVQATGPKSATLTAVTAPTTSDSRPLSALRRWRSSARKRPRIASSITPRPAPK